MNIVCGGCSFTRQYKRLGLNGSDNDFLDDELRMWRWPHHIQDLYTNYNVYNLGNPTHDNTCIAHSVIKKSTELLKSGISPKDIKIIIQWSDQDRDSYFFSNKVTKEYNCEVIEPTYTGLDMRDDRWSHLSTFAEKNHFDKRWGYYLLNGGFMWNHIKYPTDILEANAKYISSTQSLIRLLTNYMLIQNFCNVHEIEFFTFSLSYNFYDDNANDTAKGYQNTLENVYKLRKITKIKMDFNIDNPYINYLFDNIDLSKNYFYQDDTTNIGGIMEWTISNFNYDEDGEAFMEHELGQWNSFDEFYEKSGVIGTGHVSQQMNKRFVKEILSNFLDN
jgi:hypothetical protein